MLRSKPLAHPNPFGTSLNPDTFRSEALKVDKLKRRKLKNLNHLRGCDFNLSDSNATEIERQTAEEMKMTHYI